MEKTIILKKQEEVNALAEKMKNAKTIVALDYIGLPVADFEQLRKELRKSGCEIKVYKNNIARRASELSGFGALASTFAGPKAIAMSSDDVVAPAKIVNDFAKTHDKVKIMGGVIEGEVADQNKMLQLASIPSRETLLTQLAAGMLGTLTQLSIGLNMVAEQKEN